MPYINLIHENRLAIKKNQQQAQAYFFTFAGTVGIFVIAFGALSIDLISKTTSRNRLQAQVTALQPLQKQIDQNSKEEDELKPRLEALTNAQEYTQHWTGVLNHISKQTPSDVWLTNLNCSSIDQTKPVQATFMGEALSQPPVSEYVFRLQNSPDLSNVNLQFTQGKDSGSGTHLTDFQISADIVGTAEQPPAKVTK